MTTTGARKTTSSDADTSWANETLPLDLRRELLNQELERFTARRQHTSGAGLDAGKSSSGHHRGGGGDHPSATGEDAAHD
ncbi:MAG: hypothetical protein V4864_21720 [Pseudomonadota bacterium]